MRRKKSRNLSSASSSDDQLVDLFRGCDSLLPYGTTMHDLGAEELEHVVLVRREDAGHPIKHGDRTEVVTVGIEERSGGQDLMSGAPTTKG